MPTVRTDTRTWASVAGTKAHTVQRHTHEGSLCAAPQRSDPVPALRDVSSAERVSPTGNSQEELAFHTKGQLSLKQQAITNRRRVCSPRQRQRTVWDPEILRAVPLPQRCSSAKLREKGKQTKKANPPEIWMLQEGRFTRPQTGERPHQLTS